ncbi:MAG: branched-chain amino acid ABC transporter permease, partial [Hyphomicrobiales bacterium]|nr:branched-chain amino acid ABC transporter permease [Hyphomicrobiales bacterium]
MSAQPVSHSVSSPASGGSSLLPFVVLAACLIIGPSLIYPVFLMKALCFAMFACAFNILLGFTGLLSFGHAAFLGMASYSSAHAAKVWGLTPELAIAFGTLVAMALGTVIGMLTIRSRGIYFANITLAFAQMVFFFCLQAKFTGGEDGIQSVPRGSLFGLISLKSDMAMYVFVAVVFFITFLMIY